MTYEMPKCRITVLKRTINQDLIDEYLDDKFREIGPCECFRDGQEIITVPVDNMTVKCATIGNTMFHIVSSTAYDGVIAKFVRDRGEGLHHIAFRVRDMDEIVSRLREKGVKLVPDDPISFGPSGPSYIFVHPKSTHGVLIELIWPGKQES